MEKLRIDSGLKRVEVNDKGEFIEFSVTDNGFLRKLAGLLRWFGGQDEGIGELQKYQEDIFAGDGGDMNFEALNKALDTRDRIIKEACGRIDDVFGAEACRKIFGGIMPDFWAISDFLGQISPLIEKFTRERTAVSGGIAQKYSRDRKGARSPKPDTKKN